MLKESSFQIRSAKCLDWAVLINLSWINPIMSSARLTGSLLFIRTTTTMKIQSILFGPQIHLCDRFSCGLYFFAFSYFVVLLLLPMGGCTYFSNGYTPNRPTDEPQEEEEAHQKGNNIRNWGEVRAPIDKITLLPLLPHIFVFVLHIIIIIIIIIFFFRHRRWLVGSNEKNAIFL